MRRPDIHQILVEVGCHRHLAPPPGMGWGREFRRGDVVALLQVANTTLPRCGGVVAREVRIIRDLLAGVIIRTDVRGGAIWGGDRDMLRGCAVDLGMLIG